MSNTNVHKDLENKTLTIDRVFNAPIDAVFAAFSDGSALEKWWGPRGWETTTKEMEFSPGGHWLYCMKCVDKEQGEFFGQESWGKSVYKEIVAPELIAYDDYFTDENGVVTPNMPVMNITVHFEEIDGKTKITNVGVVEDAEEITKLLDMGMLEGITQTWDRLEEYVTA